MSAPIDAHDITLDLDTGALLTEGGDGRQILDARTGQNRYGCSFVPDADLIAFGSCTGSTVGERGFRAAEVLHRRLAGLPTDERRAVVRREFSRLRHHVGTVLTSGTESDVDVMITPSGTDAELIPLALFAAGDDASIVNVVMGPAEVGSGTTNAAAGQAFDEITPNGASALVGGDVDESLAERTTVREVLLRHADGAIRSDSDIDAEVVDIVAAAIGAGSRVLLHVVAHSKTGVHAPTLATATELEERYGDRIGVVVDAAQGRVSRRGLNISLARGHMVILTGSKFFGGPPFSGAVLVPGAMSPSKRGLSAFPPGFGRYFSSAMLPEAWSGLASSLPDEENLGLLLRWEAARAEIDAYYDVDQQSRLRVLRAFESMVPSIMADFSSLALDEVAPPLLEDGVQRLLESKMTVFPFALSTDGSARLGREELVDVHRWMFEDRSDAAIELADSERALLGRRIHLGQPVSVGVDRRGPAVLRIAIGAPKIVDLATDVRLGASLADRLDRLADEITTTGRALQLCAQRYAELAQPSSTD
ncbi:hypothetical protein [Ilumatobacter nonamiensis]|uniref:hypothetical protein n=1 Tax=Ilumatobacter nonamiensis TaxID=467093 RepID=UPI000345BDBE|nr:hypothetical protein [Ilumatobacter nonamiensis]